MTFIDAVKAKHGRSGAGRGERQSAAERRETVLDAAMAEFARGGYAGTSTEAIAKRAGISQPYLFRLFRTKRDLFVSTVARVHERIEAAFREAADGLTGIDAMVAMGHAYKELVGDRDLLLVQLHGFAASSDPVIRDEVRAGFEHLFTVASGITGLSFAELRPFFAQGMLVSALAAMDATSLRAEWVEGCMPDPEVIRTSLASPSHFGI